MYRMQIYVISLKYLIWNEKEHQVRNKYSGRVYVVAESLLSALPSERPKSNLSNGPADDSKKSKPKTERSADGKKENVDNSYEILDRFSGSTLVGMKWVFLLLLFHC